MATIEITRGVGSAFSIVINGKEMSDEIFVEGLELLEVGDDPGTSEVALQVRLAVLEVSLDGKLLDLTNVPAADDALERFLSTEPEA